jgi:predicted CxxxxCH...CXXCH cytochrome family protein
MKKPFIVLGIALAFSLSAGSAHSAGPSHAEFVQQYKGTATCTAASCHEGAAKEVAESLHYQHRAVPQFLENWEAGKFAGMMESY